MPKQTYRYSRYFSRVTRQPWAILPEKLADLRDLARVRLSGGRLSDQEIAARLGSEEDRAADVARKEGGVAIIPIHGTIAYRADSFEASSGGVSTERLGRRIQDFAKDESVKALVLDIDSPGGSVDGLQEFVALLGRVTRQKPIFAIANSLAASAAYWIASQAEELSVTPSGAVGSIGVYMLLIDESKALDQEGIVINAISAGEHKLEGAWWQALSDESRAHFQGHVDDFYRKFVKDVATGRGVTVEQVEAKFGRGRVYLAKEAVRRGLADRVETLDQLVARLVGDKPVRRGARADAEELAIAAVADESEKVAPAEADDSAAAAAASGEPSTGTELTDAERDEAAILVALS